ncbi:MAG: acetyl-CoA carboxylase biotin carboxylase subunit [Candidatus Marinimicrobia bacterium]|nr:acetyl-CoA carboxylase biotin carboxylase subunit [Candidatus Neomarinimicrobiota bacterium]MBL7023044.1 acetyl-CoA carboxylase biotin carboxylase subunit [Candidatus Neomarinimicrobiota bacterium]MBL7110145.1 acetyl-CoA carboxylase biotin carboxylase subunit [Candidatus Neomarinimicrobiota bacterium]
MFKKILIANRGEIALRVIRACRELNIQTVAVYSTADELSLHVRFADEAICIGPPESTKSYLNIPSIISAAELTNADAIHPGYGFLSESAEFSEICREHDISFIGPPPETINAMGDKANAKETMKSVGVPVIPGSEGVVNTVEEALIIAETVGFPVMLKASAGGGGRGMRLAKSASELDEAFHTAQSEALTAFNNGDMYLEKFIQEPRHIEVQILADAHGNVAALGERECSIQRRHQKLLEESPSVAVSPEIRKRMSDSAIKGVKAANYLGAGTIEFLLDINGDFYFMEMNTRIQVEHPVTEMVIGADLIKYQILCHAEMPLPEWMLNTQLRGHAIECRINAEDPDHKFRPSPGKITSFHMPGGMGIRVDTHAYAGYHIPPNYDSMIAKLVVHAPSRKEAINRMRGALDECVIEGIKTSVPFHKQLLMDEEFCNGNFDTSFLETFEYIKNKD